MTKHTTVPKGTEITGAITKHMDRRFMNSMDLMGQGVVELTIDRVEKVDLIEYENGNKDTNAILMYFTETKKPLKLCATNIRLITFKLKSTDVNTWKGRKIKLHVEEVKAFGKMQPAVRIA